MRDSPEGAGKAAHKNSTIVFPAPTPSELQSTAFELI